MSLDTPRDLFIHELSDTMSAEHIVLKMLAELEAEATNDDAKKAFKEHQAETQQQIRTLEKVFKQLGEEPEQTTCHAAEGLKQEHEALREEQPSPMVREIGNLAGASKTEHYEIASYTALIQMARDLGEREIADMLKGSLDQEKEMARRVESIAKHAGKEKTAAD